MSSVTPFPSTKNATADRIQSAAARWIDAKAAERAANKARLEAEVELVSLIDHLDEGTSKTEVGAYKITITGKMTRTLDAAQVATLDAQIPAEILRRVIEYRPTLSVREYRYIQENEPEYFKALAACVTTRPAKPSIDVEVL